MNGARALPKYSKDQNNTAQLANEFNNFYMAISSPKICQIGNYRITEEIGEGAFGKVYLATHVLLNVNVVLKCGLIDDPNIVREIYYHKQLKHKNIVSLYEVIKTENHLWIAMEYCEGGELYYLVYERRRLELNECRHIFFQVLLGVQFVHSMNLSHRDLKLENILLSDKKKSCVKLTDFGFIREFNPHSRRFLSTICGTTVYMAPELLLGQKYSGFAIDVWSLGIILYTMLYGVLPFDDDDEMKIKTKIINDDPTFADFVPEEVNQLILKMLSKDPTKRPGISEILNSSFLIDAYNKHLEKNQKKAVGDGESILSINQHYNYMQKPFDTRIERELIRKLQRLNVDIDELQASIYSNEMNSLTAFYELLLTREFSKKKKRYIRDKKRKYFEARNSLRKSRKKVKSALSMSDQLSGSQPLERIISTLSITSNKNSSKTNLNRLSTYSKKSGDNIDLRNLPRSQQNARFSIDRDHSNRNSVGEIGRSDMTVHSQAISPTSTKIDAPLHRIVSFVPQERRPSDAASTGESLKKQNKGGKILNKLQFWKKDKNGNDGDKDDSTSVVSRKSEKYENDTGSGNLELQLQQSPQRFDRSQTSFEVGDSEQVPVTTGSDTRQAEGELEPAVEVQASGSNHLTPTSGDGRGLTRTRPSSMISQISQISRLSQLSTMLSESELDILDETDTLDDDDDEDEAYDSSISMSQDGRSSTGMVSGSSRVPTKKRPSYRRGMSSDQSIQSVSTTGGQSTVKKKLSMSRVTSNSSDDTPSESKYADEVPPMNGDTNAHSQFMVKNRPSSLVTPTPVLHSNSIHPNFNTNEIDRLQGYRSHSPPFNFKQNQKSMPRSDAKMNRKLMPPTFANKNNSVPHNYQDIKQVNDWLNNPLTNNTGSHGYANKTMYGPIIDEEDEDDEV